MTKGRSKQAGSMALSNMKILCLNLAGGTLFLHHLLSINKPDILLVQEVLLSTEELQLKVQPYGYKCESNIDILNSTKPGTAVIWNETVPVKDTQV